MRSISSTFALAFFLTLQLVNAHFEILYPGWRGNSLHTNEQWIYPCGGLDVTTNRTKWPITGGAVAVIPGWNSGHPTSFFYINMGYGSDPANMTNIMQPVFQTTGPSSNPFPGTWCLPQVPLPANASVSVGDNATIQVIQVALHGASLYNCADVTLVDAADADPIPDGYCTNSSDIGFNLVYTTHNSGASSLLVNARTLTAVFIAGLTLGWLLRC
ncbi:hypothetical protein RUND412_010910 [Rhizina undulata]